MPIPNPFRRLTASTSTVDELSAELGRLDRIRLDAQNQLHDLGAKRPGLLLDGTDAALAKLDGDMATARRAVEQAEARIAVIEPEWRAADHRETTARLDRERRDRYAAAAKARAEGVKLLDAYDREAASLAAKLRRLAEIEQVIAAANADLPADYPPVVDVETFNGRPPVPDATPTFEVWVGPEGQHLGHTSAMPEQPMPGARRRTVQGYGSIPGAPGIPHRPLAARIALPAVDPNAAPHWSGGLVGNARLSADAAAVLRYHGIQP